MAFRGQQEHSLDSKDRITIPARFRAALADGVVLFAGLDTCVDLYSLDEFAAFEKSYLANLSPMNRHSRMLRRRFYAGSEEVQLDSAGRVRFPKSLLEHAELSGACVIVGAGDHLEIWSQDAWAPERDEFEEKAAELAEELDSSASNGGHS